MLDHRHALFLDFDGTLAPLQANPDTVALPDPLGEIIPQLNAKLGGALAIVSGRDIRDLSSRVPLSVWRAGGHGLETCAPDEAAAVDLPSAPDGLSDAIEACLTDIPGSRMEDKGLVKAVHYRNAPDSGDELIARITKAIKTFPGYKVQAGKMVIEAKPDAANKGNAIAAMMENPAFAGRIPVMAGDDVTDEDGFARVQALGGFAIKVGDGPTLAEYRVASTGDIAAWLEALVAS